MNVKASDLWTSMIAAVRGSLGSDWQSARNYAEPELKRLARVLLDIGKLAVEGKISEAEAQSLLRIHRRTTEAVLLAVKGLGVLAVENAVNAALGAVRNTVNNAAGFAML